MAYTAADIIDKAIEILNRRIEEYERIEKENEDVPYVKIISKVIIKESHETMRYYEDSKHIVGNESFEEIDFHTYDKISFLINQFNQRTYSLKFTNAKEYFENLLEFQRDVRTLYVDIQGRLVRNADDVNKITYEILTNIINHKTGQIIKLEEILKKKW